MIIIKNMAYYQILLIPRGNVQATQQCMKQIKVATLKGLHW